LDWANAAILSTAVMAVVNILDSHLVTKRMPSFRAFLIPAGILSGVNGAILLGLFPLPQNIGIVPLSISIASSVLRALAVLLILHILKTGEVSRVIPVVHSHPVFVAILAVLLLGETLVYLQWIAVMVTVAGAMIISIERGSRIGMSRSLARSLLASLLLATANLTSKYAMEHVSYWNMVALGNLLLAFIFLSVSLRPLPVRQLRALRRPILATGLLVLNNALVLVGLLLMLLSIQSGPVSLVAAILGARPAFVFVYAVILSRISHVLLEKRMGRQTIALRLGAIGMIVGGITIIHLA
jgi:drug/metabolite transporter (DMT)-like permease